MDSQKKSVFGIINLIALCMLVLVLSFLPTLSLAGGEDFSLGKIFSSEPSEFQGILEVWNIDTFEAGSSSKESFLLEVAKEFQKQNKGTYIIVKNLTIDELNLSLQAGKTPDLFSFGFGVGDILKSYLCEIGRSDSKYQALDESGVVDGKTFAVGYLLGGYYLFSTQDKILNAGLDSENIILSEKLNNAGYVKELRNGGKKVHSVSYGKSLYNTPLKAIENYYVSAENIKEEEDDFEAYQNFISFESSTILLGTQRTLARLENKVRIGQLDSFLCEVVSSYCDLVQYLGVCKNASELKQKYAQKFIDMVLSEEMAKTAIKIGMLPANSVSQELWTGSSEWLYSLYLKYEEDLFVPKLFS